MSRPALGEISRQQHKRYCRLCPSRRVQVGRLGGPAGRLHRIQREPYVRVVSEYVLRNPGGYARMPGR